MKFDQMSLVIGICGLLDKQHKGAKVFSRQMNAIALAATSIVDAMNRADVPSTPNQGLGAWLSGDDTGLSSRAMAFHLMGGGCDQRESRAYPHDPADFGRCHRFLEAVPEARPKLQVMSQVSDIWKALVANWDELTALYLEEHPTGIAPKLYARMKQLGT